METSSDADSERIHALLSKQQQLLSQTPEILLPQNNANRVQLLELATELVTQLTQPAELVSDIAHGAGRFMCLRIADDLNLFELLAERPHSPKELAAITEAEEGLIVRILRMLAATGFVAQAGRLQYEATAAGRNMVKDSVRAGTRVNFNESSAICHHVPAYFRANGYRLPQSMTDTPFQAYHNTSLDNHKYWVEQDPATMADLQTFMNGLYGGEPKAAHWTTWYGDRLRQLLQGVSKDQVAFVDVAGGRGHECEMALKATLCDGRLCDGRFILQDLWQVIEDVDFLDPRIERTVYDFLEPQPVKGARIYFLSNILHDHPTPVCQQILNNLLSAMKPGYSTLLISNMILPDENDDDESLRGEGQPTRYQLDMDLTMLVLSGGAQRTRREWRDLVAGAGFQDKKMNAVEFVTTKGDGNGIIEVEVSN